MHLRKVLLLALPLAKERVLVVLPDLAQQLVLPGRQVARPLVLLLAALQLLVLQLVA
jgi:hypothetical protein